MRRRRRRRRRWEESRGNAPSGDKGRASVKKRNRQRGG